MGVVLCFLFSLLSTTSAFVCDFTDCQALLQFKAGIISDPEGHLEAWNEFNPFCNWTGITCHRYQQNRVVALQLIDMHLDGGVSPFLSNLSLLTRLSLQENKFHGEIPASLGMLRKLQTINMSNNLLEGSIPASLHGCQRLEVLDMNFNTLSGAIPDELGWIKQLTLLALSKNNFTGAIPVFLSNLTELRRLELAFNNFTGKVPKELGAITKLEILYLHNNFLEGAVPASISNCTALLEISVIENLISGEIPFEMGKLQNLQKVYFHSNYMSGRIPVTLSNLSRLTLLDLNSNYLEGKVPAELGKLKNLEFLSLHSNYLVSDSSLSFLTALTNCSFLQKLNLRTCLFAGSLPASIGDLSKNLYYFNLLTNSIREEIPDSIGNLSGLVTLNLQENYLDGTIPAALGKLWQLQRLNLGSNRLHGFLPDEMAQMEDLGILDLSNNSITGSIPSWLGKLSQLRYLYLSHNNLSGRIPIEVTHCSVMMMLDLSFNNLHGSLPTDIGLLSESALSLNFSNNNLEGEIPASIVKLTSMQEIDLSKNKFSGVIPNLVGNCISLNYLNLSNNMLEGTIPESFKQITYLKVLDLSFNLLTGSVPIWIASDSKIENFNFSYNRLTGEVPKMGRFQNISISSLMGNVGLCSCSALKGLHPCQVNTKKKQSRKSFELEVAFSCFVLLLIFVAICIRCFFFRKRTAESDEQNLKASAIRHFTQRELEVATLGFNEANLLGRGSFGSVYKAQIDGGESIVAVKVLGGEHRQSYKSFKREGQILSGIKHRNLVRMVGAAWNPNFKALVLEFISNGTLGQHLYPTETDEGNGPLTLRERLSIAIDIANALDYLHEGCSVQVVHCDLKPQNVLLDNDIVAHVTDFGIGKLILSDKPQGDTTASSFLRGSVGYIPPEYGQSGEISVKGDVYSFGIILLELITRQSPTGEMFTDGLDLRKWVGAAHPHHILDVVDMSLKQEAHSSSALAKLELCCGHVLEVGMMCTQENPQSRPSISLITRGLQNLWKQIGFGR